MLKSPRKEIEELINNLLGNLTNRSKDVLEKRFGLQSENKKQTLETIGKFYNITRERVRQIENSSKQLIIESNKFETNTKKIINSLIKSLNDLGGVVSENDFLENLREDETQRNHIKFLMEISRSFTKKKEQDFKDNIWFTDENNYTGFVSSLNNLYRKIDTNELLTKEEIIDKFLEELKKNTNNKKILQKDIVKKLLAISKKVDSNKLGQWGLTESRNISGRAAKDYVYLVLKKENKPMHFRDIAEEVRQNFDSNIHTASCHNELIKDERFIIIGRGIYGLKEWGNYSGETVLEVISRIIKKSKKSLTSAEIVTEVLKQKQVKKQTIIINLGNKEKFKRMKNGKFVIV